MIIVAITQARMSSSRLPGKVLKEVSGKSLVKIHFERVSKSKCITEHILATSNSSADDALEKFAKENKVKYFRGDENNVLERFIECLKSFDKVDYVVRLTADCPLVDADLIDACINLIREKKLDYVSNCIEPTFPDGIDIEVFTYDAIQKAHREATLKSDKEHVTPYIWRNSNLKNGTLFKAYTLKCENDYSKVRLTVDEPLDFDLIVELVNKFGTNEPWLTYANYVLTHSSILNQSIKRNEGYIKSLKKD